MLSTAFMLLLSGAFLTLRLGPGSGVFPRPLCAEEERAAVEAWVNAGDLDARNKLVEHNLRLVAHIIKKGWRGRRIFSSAAILPVSLSGAGDFFIQFCQKIRRSGIPSLL